jgi:hypothetical protein
MATGQSADQPSVDFYSTGVFWLEDGPFLMTGPFNLHGQQLRQEPSSGTP